MIRIIPAGAPPTDALRARPLPCGGGGRV